MCCCMDLSRKRRGHRVRKLKWPENGQRTINSATEIPPQKDIQGKASKVMVQNTIKENLG